MSAEYLSGGAEKNRAFRKAILFCAPLVTIALYFACAWRLYFFDDEFYTVNICRAPWSGFLNLLISSDVHPPFSYFLFKLWFSVFGVNVAAGQIFSLILTAAGVFIYCYTFTRIFPRIKWLFIFVAIHPLIILWAGSARYYSLLFLLFNLSTLIFLKTIRNYSVRNLFLFALVSVMGLYTEFMYFLALIPQSVFILYSLNTVRDKSRALYLKRFLITLLAITFAYLPWVSRTAFLICGNLERFARPSVFLNLIYIIYGSFLGQSIMPYDWIVVWPAAVILGILFAAGLFKMLKQEPREFLLWSVLSLGALVLAIPIRLSTIRHFLYFPGLLLIPVFYSIAGMRRKGLRLLCVFVLLGIYAYANINIALKRDIHKGGLTDPIAQVIEKVSGIASSDRDMKIVLMSNAFNYYLSENNILSRQLEYFDPSDPQVSIKLYGLLLKNRPVHVLYLWSYYGAQEDSAAIDRMAEDILRKNYRLVAQYRLNKDERLRKLYGLIDKHYQNPKGYRIIIQEYLLKQAQDISRK